MINNIVFTSQTGSANPFSGVSFDVGYSSSPIFADVDGDGDLDLLVGSEDGVLRYYLNTGNANSPSYISQIGSDNPFLGIVFVSDYYGAPSFADIDGDGDFDLVVGREDGKLNYFTNTGTATAPKYERLNGSVNPFDGFDVGNYSAPSLADIDSDGDLDLVVGNEDGTLNYFENTGTATAPAYTSRTGTNNPFHGFTVGQSSSPSFIDIDRDGDLDLVVGNEDGTLNYFENTGSATDPVYTDQSPNPFTTPFGYFSAPSFADIDGDGDPDLVVGREDGKLSYERNDSDPYPDPVYIQASGPDNPLANIKVAFYSSPSFADIDGDGDLDLVVGQRNDELSYFKNTGTATAPAYSEQSGTANPFKDLNVGFRRTPSFADIDGDGDLDLVVGEIIGTLGNFIGALNFYENTGTATAPVYSEQSGTANPFKDINVGTRMTPSFADIDGDGDLDLVVGANEGKLNYYENTGTATAPSYILQAGAANPFHGIDVGRTSAPTFADFDGDGDLDLMVGEAFGFKLNYFENTGTATAPSYLPENRIFGLGSYSAPSFADIDGDGDIDLAVGESFGSLNFLLNVVCFLPGTLIATPTGERPIESLQIGELICTAEGPQPVKFVCRTTHNPVILWNIDSLPICIKAGALGDALPRRDLYLSGGHALLIDGHLIQASALVNGSTIIQTEPEDWDKQKRITYYNIELEKHELITAEGITAESFYDILDRSNWDNYDQYLSLYSSEQPLQELPLPRVNFKRQLSSALRQKLQQLEANALSRQPLVAAAV